MNEKTCPTCGEENSEDAVKCWKCRTKQPLRNPLQKKFKSGVQNLSFIFWNSGLAWRPNRKGIVQFPSTAQLAHEAWRDVKICAKCSSRNLLSASTCWMCKSPLTKLPAHRAKRCLVCECHNSEDAVVCNGCLSSTLLALDDQPIGEIRCPQCDEANLEISFWCWSCGNNLRQPATFFVSNLLVIGIVLLAISGWLPNPYGWLALGMGVAIIWSWLEDGRERFLQQFKLQREPPSTPETNNLSAYEPSEPSDDITPITHIANVILLDAIHDGATRISLEAMKRGVVVRFEINGEWSEEMKVPAAFWVPLREHFQQRAASLQTVGRGKGLGRDEGSFECILGAQKYHVHLNHEWLEEQPRERITLDLS